MFALAIDGLQETIEKMESDRSVMHRQMKLDQLLKETAVAKLTEVMQKKDRKSLVQQGSRLDRKKAIELRKLRKDLEVVSNKSQQAVM